MADPTALTGLAPTGAVGIVLAMLLGIVREWRMGRQADVAYQRRRADDAEAERDRLAEQHAQDRDALASRIGHLEGEMRRLRDDGHRHEDDLARRLESELRMGFRLREHLAAHGLDLPVDLDPARPDIAPNLGLSAPLPPAPA